jgi:prepilin-type N-terminal cleavage/methylation domain-containing protein
MVIWLKESNKGFTLIELMVVVAIIGVLVLLSLRTYAPQKERAANSIVKANASTVQTMLVGYMGSHDILVASAAADITTALNGVVAETGHPLESMVNPYSDIAGVYHIDTAGASDFDAAAVGHQGKVSVLCKADNDLLVNARGKDGEPLFDFNKALPANKY